jgi:hypothetical protein
MKKLFLSAIILFLSFISNAQTPVPNGDFENWLPYKYCSIVDSLADYVTFDQLALFGFEECPNFNSAIKSTDKYSGTYALELNPYFNGIDYSLSAVYSSLSGNPPKPMGVPFTDTPSKLTGYIKFNQVGNDVLTILVQILDKNGNVKGAGEFIQTSSLADYTKFEIPIMYAPNGAANALIITFTVGQPNSYTTNSPKANEGTKMVVDDLTFEYGTTTSTTHYTSTSSINVFAANKNINFSDNVSDVHVVDMTGVNALQETASTKQLNAGNLKNGLYVVTYKYNDNYFSKKVVLE